MESMQKIQLEKEHKRPSNACLAQGQERLHMSNAVPYMEGPGRTTDVLVIDDSATIRKIVETALSREGYAVKSFPDGVEAIRWLMTPQACVPRLVILDIGLPKMNGYEVARLLKRKPSFHHTVIVMLTGRDGILDRFKGRLSGAQTYLTKPVTTQALLAAVKTHLGGPVPVQM